MLLLDLVDDAAAIAAYEGCHSAGAMPAAVIANISRVGLRDMEIHRRSAQLMSLIKAKPGYGPVAKTLADAAKPDVQSWKVLRARVRGSPPGAAAGQK